MTDYHIENNKPATHASITQTEKTLGSPLPDCLKEILRQRDGFQVYTRPDMNDAKWKYSHGLLVTDVDHIDQPFFAERIVDDDLDNIQSIVGVTDRLRELFVMFAQEEDRADGIDHNPNLLDGFICIAEKDDHTDEQFTYWMQGTADASDVYCIELPVLGNKILPPIREQIKQPSHRFEDFILDIDVNRVL